MGPRREEARSRRPGTHESLLASQAASLAAAEAPSSEQNGGRRRIAARAGGNELRCGGSELEEAILCEPEAVGGGRRRALTEALQLQTSSATRRTGLRASCGWTARSSTETFHGNPQCDDAEQRQRRLANENLNLHWLEAIRNKSGGRSKRLVAQLVTWAVRKR